MKEPTHRTLQYLRHQVNRRARRRRKLLIKKGRYLELGESVKSFHLDEDCRRCWWLALTQPT
jgi:hypothetical protein